MPRDLRETIRTVRNIDFPFSMKRLAIPLAIGFHVIATILVWIVGKFAPSFRFPDAVKYQAQIVALADVIRSKGLAAWFFSFAALSRQVVLAMFRALCALDAFFNSSDRTAKRALLRRHTLSCL